MLKSIIALITAAVSFICGCFSDIVDAVFFPEAPRTESVEFAKKLGNGWNLGNTLDACNKGSTEKKGPEIELLWGNPYTTREMIESVKAAGFNSVRIPITWAQHMDEDHTIDEAWLDRVNQIVDWVLDCGMYAIINVHHDDAFWLIVNKSNETKATQILTKIWSQVSERFKDYDERLVFETMNEPRVVGSETEWNGVPEHREVVNNLNAAALETIRSSGESNETRFVMITTYAARPESEYTSALALPEDSHVLVSVHYYYGTAHSKEYSDCEKDLTLSDKISIYKSLRNLYKTFMIKGYGVVLGEFGWTDRTNLDNLAERAEFFVDMTNRFGIPCIVWDDGGNFRLFDRVTLTWEYPEYVKAAANVN